MTNETEVKKSFSDVVDDNIKHEELVKLRKKFHEEQLKQSKEFHKENLEEQKKANKEQLKQSKEIEEKRYSQYEKWQKWTLIIMIVLVSANLILAGVSLVSWSNNKKLVERQLEAIAPLKPELHIFLDGDIDDLIFGRSYLARMSKTKDNKTVVAQESIYFVFQNIGRLDTGHIYARLRNNWTRGAGVNINNIEGESSEKASFKFHYKGCYETSKYCNEEDVPLGIQELQLTIKCDYCKERVIEKTIKICVWDSSPIDCDFFKKKYKEQIFI